MIVSLAEMKAHLRVEFGEDDKLIKNYIQQAQDVAEAYCRVSFEDLDDVPTQAKLAVMLLAGHFYEVRDGSDKAAYDTTMRAFHDLLFPLRNIAF